MDFSDTNNIKHESDVPFFPTALRWGLIATAISIIFALVSNLLGIANSQMALSTVLGLTITVVMAYMTIKSHREELDGFISFGRAFLVAFIALLISSVLSSIFNFIYMNYIDPSSMDAALEVSEKMMVGFGMPEDNIEQAMEEARKSMESPWSIINGILFLSIFSAIFAAIVAGIMKKVRPTGY